MALYGNFFGPVQYVPHGENKIYLTSGSKKLNFFYKKIVLEDKTTDIFDL